MKCTHPFWTNKHTCAKCGIKLHEYKNTQVSELKSQLKTALDVIEIYERALNDILAETWILSANDRDRWQGKLREALTQAKERMK